MPAIACLGHRIADRVVEAKCGRQAYHEAAADQGGSRVVENKTKPGRQSVAQFLNAIEDTERRNDAKKVAAMMRKATGKRATLWGTSIVGFGKYHYKYASGREGDWALTGFSPRKQNLVVYIMPGFAEFSELMEQLGKYKTGKSCLYLKKLDDVDAGILEKLITRSVKVMRKRYNVK